MEVPIRNTSLLKRLDTLVEEFYNIYNPLRNDIKVFRGHREDSVPMRADIDWYMSRERLQHYLDDWENHDGDPHDYHAIPVGNLRKSDPDSWNELYEKWRFKFATDIGVSSCALMNFYPERGLTGWHTNWAANAYQILFTWSKTGDGYFAYYDKEKDEVVKIQDKPGWQCRWFYFGRKDEPEHHCWHGCYTNSERITLAYKFSNDSKSSPKDEYAQMLRDELVEDIMREE